MNAVLGLLLLSAPAELEPLRCLSFEPGSGAAAVEEALGPGRRLRAGQPQALAAGLLRSGLLEVLNVLRAAPRAGDQPGLDPAAFAELLLFERGEARCVFAFAFEQGRLSLRLALAQLPVPVDIEVDRPLGSSPARLSRLSRALAAVRGAGWALRARERDAHGNSFVWEAEQRGRALRVWYQPERDRLSLLSMRTVRDR